MVIMKKASIILFSLLILSSCSALHQPTIQRAAYVGGLSGLAGWTFLGNAYSTAEAIKIANSKGYKEYKYDPILNQCYGR